MSQNSTAAVLAALAAGPADAAEIAERAGIGRSTASKALAALAGQGTVERTPGGREGGRRLADLWSTQGQSLPAFGLALLLGFDLLPRIRNWADLVFYLPEAQVCYRHIDALFARDAVINWKLIERHWPDLMRTVLSIRAGRVSSASLLRRLGTHSHKNRLYQAFVELGRAVRTIVLLRYLSEPELREGITTVTNRVEAFHGFSGWLMFGNEGILADNDPEHQEKIIKFNELLANCAIYHTTLDITEAVRQLLAEGEEVDPVDLATVAPYITSKIKRFGDWVLDLSEPPPSAPPRLDLASLRPPGPA